MAVYSIQGNQTTLTSGAKTAMSIIGAASNPRRGKVFDMNMSQASAPASTDTNIVFALGRITAAGTGTAYTPTLADPADAAATTVGAVNHTIEPTYTANQTVFSIGLNQRAPYRWQTYLGSGGELVWPATASNGFGFNALSAGYTSAAGGTIFFQEQ
jgi:hypothetical protein